MGSELLLASCGCIDRRAKLSSEMEITSRICTPFLLKLSKFGEESIDVWCVVLDGCFIRSNRLSMQVSEDPRVVDHESIYAYL